MTTYRVEGTLSELTSSNTVYPSGTVINVTDKNITKIGDGVTAFTSLLSPSLAGGGTTGQVLAKVNSTDFNTQWVDKSEGLFNFLPSSYISGRSYYPQFSSASGKSPLLNTYAFVRLVITKKITIDKLGIYVPTGGATNCKLVVYTNDTTTTNSIQDYPRLLLVETATFSISATGEYNVAISEITLDTGVYWVGINADATNGLVAYSTPTQTLGSALGIRNGTYANNISATFLTLGYSFASANPSDLISFVGSMSYYVSSPYSIGVSIK
jgi:hypothetical protein